MPGTRGTICERLSRHYRVDSATGCWVWTGTRNHKGYGYISTQRGKSPKGAHIVAYETAYGPVPDGMEIDHLCRNRACVNPAHLEAVTHHANLLRGDTLAGRKARQTHCKHGHPFTPENTIRDRDGCRRCRECERLKNAQRNQKGDTRVA